jgi:pimeloyl-ACP methyl ester carboxylesterase
MEMRRVDIGGFHLAVHDSGSAGGLPPVICVHGLTRRAADFERLVAALAPTRRVLAVDVAGRGDSDRLIDPTHYQVPVYVAQMLALLDRLELKVVDWIGTSMGGLIGMGLAATAPTRVRRMVLNDIGPFLPKEAVAEIVDRVKRRPLFADFDEALAYYRQTSAANGIQADADWRWYTGISIRPADGGGFEPHWDPAIVGGFAQAYAEDVALWPTWALLTQPILVLRGAESTLLPRATALGMATRPDTRLVEVPGCGHAPSLIQADEIEAIRAWLATP